MSIDKTGAVVARAAGVVLVVIGGSSFLTWLFEPGIATSGWTSYSPFSTNGSSAFKTPLQDTFFLTSATAALYLPGAAQSVIGLAMILFSRPVGRWLAGGLKNEDRHDGG